MDYKNILSAAELNENLDNPDWAIMDCRFDINDKEKGYQDYLAGHIPGSLYINLDQDLSGEIIPGKTGRHPLPDIKIFADRLSSWGIDGSTKVVIYDDNNNGLASRMWWMLQWLGHENASLLNGGWSAWDPEKYPVETDERSRKQRDFSIADHSQLVVDADFVEEIRSDPDYILVDSRGADRYWGLNETIDPVAGHIPGAVTAPYAGNLDEYGFFLTPEQLRERFEILLDGVPPENVVFYCGSGVTACNNIIAMVEAGYEMPKLYSGSWSEWIIDPNRPVGP